MRPPRLTLLGFTVFIPATLLIWSGIAVYDYFAKGSDTVVTGRATAIDGDTLRLGKAHIRLFGIDAPELEQTCTYPTGATWACGRAAHDALTRLVGDGVDVVCGVQDRDRHQRLVATCFAGGRDLAEAMVTRGLAIAYRRYSQAYVPAEARTRAELAGIWNGTFVEPEKWRHTRRNGR